MALQVGSRLGHYDVTALIGEGGMGEVWEATDTTLNRQVALRILPEASCACLGPLFTTGDVDMTKTAVTGFFAFQLVVGGWSVAAAQPVPEPVELSASEFHEFRTNDGTLYDVYIAFPVGYEPSGDVEYPVFYVTDAFAAFGLIAQTARALEMGRDIPPMIVVGVDNPVSSVAEWTARRSLSLTPTRVTSDSQQSGPEVRTGGADAFLAALTDEIIPWVESRYPASEGRVLYGGSLGGLFATHALFTSPDTFAYYLIGSPALWWDNEVMFEREETYANEHDDLPARVFMSVGSEERDNMKSVMSRMSGSLMNRNYPSLEIGRHIFDDETHTSVIPMYVSRGLVFLFGSR